ncbi:MAG: OsmC family protein, partial [Bryobacteraceae bacterium]
PTVGKCICQAVSRAEPPVDPLNGIVSFGTRFTAAAAYTAHEAIGGAHNAPAPVDFLCAALASCQHMTMGIAAAVLRIKLTVLEIQVDAESDVRGNLGIADLPPDLVSLRCTVRLRTAEGTAPAQIEQLITRAEQMCIVLRALRRAVPVDYRVEEF